MTTREFLVLVRDTSNDYAITGKATELLASLDERNAKRKSADSKAKRETASRRDAVLAHLSAEPIFADTVATDSGLSIGQVRSALSALVRDGIADKAEVKVGKSRKMAYTLHIGE